MCRPHRSMKLPTIGSITNWNLRILMKYFLFNINLVRYHLCALFYLTISSGYPFPSSHSTAHATRCISDSEWFLPWHPSRWAVRGRPMRGLRVRRWRSPERTTTDDHPEVIVDLSWSLIFIFDLLILVPYPTPFIWYSSGTNPEVTNLFRTHIFSECPTSDNVSILSGRTESREIMGESQIRHNNGKANSPHTRTDRRCRVCRRLECSWKK